MIESLENPIEPIELYTLIHEYFSYQKDFYIDPPIKFSKYDKLNPLTA